MIHLDHTQLDRAMTRMGVPCKIVLGDEDDIVLSCGPTRFKYTWHPDQARARLTERRLIREFEHGVWAERMNWMGDPDTTRFVHYPGGSLSGLPVRYGSRRTMPPRTYQEDFM